MPLLADSIGELTTTTLRNLNRLKWSMISTTLQEYHAYGRFLKRGQVEVSEGGYGEQWNVQVNDTGNAERSSLYDTDVVRTSETMKTATAPWAHVKAHWSMDTRVMSMNKGEAKIVDMWEAQRIGSLVALALLLETDFWSLPDASDTTKVRGLRYYIVKNSTANGGFLGGTPSGFSDVAGLNTTTFPRWRNWTDIYTAPVSQTDLIRRVKRAMRNTNFMPPVRNPSYTGMDQRWGLYTNDTVYKSLGEIAEAQNQNIGADLATYEGRTMIGGTVVSWAPFLDSDTEDPFYGVDWTSFKPVALSGEYLRETPEMGTATSHNIKTVWLDMTYLFKMYDRRRNFVISTGASI